MFNTALITVDSYRFEFRPFAYKLLFEGRIELSSKYFLGAELLVGKLTLPNQIIDLIDLVPENKESCYQNKSNSCQVFKFSNFIQLSGDSYFSREFSQPENVPFRFTLDFKTDNLESFKSYNRFSFNGENKNRELSDFLSRIKLLKIQNHFSYQNSFYIERRYSWDTSKTLKLPSYWSVTNNNRYISYEQVNIRLRNYDYINGYYIKEWFSIDTNKAVLDSALITFKEGSFIEIPKSEFDSFHLNGTIKKIDNQYRYEQDYRNSGIFFPEKTSGTLIAKLRLNGYLLTIKNPFSFNNHYLIDKARNLRIWIRPLNNTDFSKLRRFRVLSI